MLLPLLSFSAQLSARLPPQFLQVFTQNSASRDFPRSSYLHLYSTPMLPITLSYFNFLLAFIFIKFATYFISFSLIYLSSQRECKFPEGRGSLDCSPLPPLCLKHHSTRYCAHKKPELHRGQTACPESHGGFESRQSGFRIQQPPLPSPFCTNALVHAAQSSRSQNSSLHGCSSEN